MGYKDFIKIMGAFLTIILIFYMSLTMILITKWLGLYHYRRTKFDKS